MLDGRGGSVRPEQHLSVNQVPHLVKNELLLAGLDLRNTASRLAELQNNPVVIVALFVLLLRPDDLLPAKTLAVTGVLLAHHLPGLYDRLRQSDVGDLLSGFIDIE